MRLYLASSGMGNQPRALLSLVADRRRAAVIANALDDADERVRAAGVAGEVGYLRQLGLDVVEVDLRPYFGKSEQLAQVLASFNLLWVCGGNAFVLRRAFRQSWFDSILKRLLAEDAVVYGGNSAGVCILSPSLHGIELLDDSTHVPDGYEADVIWEGLGLLPYRVAPHYQSAPSELAAAVDQLVRYYIEHHLLFKALRDGEALVIKGDEELIVS